MHPLQLFKGHNRGQIKVLDKLWNKIGWLKIKERNGIVDALMTVPLNKDVVISSQESEDHGIIRSCAAVYAVQAFFSAHGIREEQLGRFDDLFRIMKVVCTFHFCDIKVKQVLFKISELLHVLFIPMTGHMEAGIFFFCIKFESLYQRDSFKPDHRNSTFSVSSETSSSDASIFFASIMMAHSSLFLCISHPIL